jgi:hypothetical protein
MDDGEKRGWRENKQLGLSRENAGGGRYTFCIGTQIVHILDLRLESHDGRVLMIGAFSVASAWNISL